MKFYRLIIICTLTISMVMIILLTKYDIDISPRDEEALSDGYQEVINFINTSLEIDGYEEILKGDDYLIGVPDSVNGIETERENNIYETSKNYIFKNAEKSVVILLAVSNSNINDSNWISTSGYIPERFNSISSPYGFSKDMPETSVFTYVLHNKGYILTLTAFSEKDISDGMLTVSELAKFTDNLTNKLNDL